MCAARSCKKTFMNTVMDSDVVGFARLSGDDNPLHLCDVYAAETRFGERIAHGLYTASLISAVLGTQLPAPGARRRAPAGPPPPAAAGSVPSVAVTSHGRGPLGGVGACAGAVFARTPR